MSGKHSCTIVGVAITGGEFSHPPDVYLSLMAARSSYTRPGSIRPERSFLLSLSSSRDFLGFAVCNSEFGLDVFAHRKRGPFWTIGRFFLLDRLQLRRFERKRADNLSGDNILILLTTSSSARSPIGVSPISGLIGFVWPGLSSLSSSFALERSYSSRNFLKSSGSLGGTSFPSVARAYGFDLSSFSSQEASRSCSEYFWLADQEFIS